LLPNEVTVEYEKPPTGDRARFNYETGVLQAPRPVDGESLWDFLHECAHANYHRDRRVFERVPRHVTEYECERWTRDRFAEEGILSEEIIKQSSRYLKREIMRDLIAVLRCGLDQRALEYLRENDRADLWQSLDSHIRIQSNGLLTLEAIGSYTGPLTPENNLMNACPQG
jgi:hypothetical protein